MAVFGRPVSSRFKLAGGKKVSRCSCKKRLMRRCPRQEWRCPRVPRAARRSSSRRPSDAASTRTSRAAHPARSVRFSAPPASATRRRKAIKRSSSVVASIRRRKRSGLSSAVSGFSGASGPIWRATVVPGLVMAQMRKHSSGEADRWQVVRIGRTAAAEQSDGSRVLHRLSDGGATPQPGESGPIAGSSYSQGRAASRATMTRRRGGCRIMRPSFSWLLVRQPKGRGPRTTQPRPCQSQ